MYKVESVLFDKAEYSLKDAVDFLTRHKLKHKKVDETDKFYKFRQVDPKTLAKQGYDKVVTKKITKGISYIIYYKERNGEGLPTAIPTAAPVVSVVPSEVVYTGIAITAFLALLAAYYIYKNVREDNRVGPIPEIEIRQQVRRAADNIARVIPVSAQEIEEAVAEAIPLAEEAANQMTAVEARRVQQVVASVIQARNVRPYSEV